jgi:opacity protein-like surface antigen
MRTALIATGLLVFSGSALAEEPPPAVIVASPTHEWFVEGGLGGAHGNMTHVEYDDPVGSLFTLNAKQGTGIIPQSVTKNPWSGAAAFSAGHFVGDRYFLRATYRYFGTRSATANGLFFSSPGAPQQIPTSFPQSITTTAHGVFLGAGVEIEPGEDWFIDPSVEIGAVLVHANGIRDVDTIIQEPYPSRAQINPAYGAGLAVGKRLTSDLALEVLMNWDNLGRADTATAPDIGGAPRLVTTPGVPGKAFMTAKVNAATIMLGIRYDF